MPTSSVVKVGCTRDGYRVRVEGQGTMRHSPKVHAFVRRTLDNPGAGPLVIDLTACDYLDSTFLGCLVDLHRRYGAGSPPRFSVVAPPGATQRLFGSTNIDRLLNIVQDAPESVGEDVELSVADLDLTDLGRHLLECHRRLAEVEGPDREVYRRVADRLAADLEARQASEAT